MTKNFTYFLKEIKNIFTLNPLSSILSLISLSMIFFLLVLTTFGGIFLSQWVGLIKQEAEVSAYFTENLNPYALEVLENQIVGIEGVLMVQLISEDEAYARMATVLGNDAVVLTYFESNPFEPFFEINLDFEMRETIVEKIEQISHVTYVRDNQEILNRLEQWIDGISILGAVVAIAVTLTTLIITSHIIREGVYSNRNHIETLKLLGAPNAFTYFPYVAEGILVSTLSGVISGSAFAYILVKMKPILESGISLFPVDITMINPFGIVLISSLFAFVLGVFASLFGLKSA